MGVRGALIVVSCCVAMPSLVVSQLLASENVNMEADDFRALEAVVTRQPVKTQQTEKAFHAVVDCRVW
jgi:hypothetical protein